MFTMNLRAIGLILLVLAIFWLNPVHAQELQVPSQFATIQSAIEAANPLDQIVVAAGTYTENLNFLGKSISLTSIDGPEFTVIDGSAMTRGPEEGSSIVFTSGESPLAILEGFTIRGGSGKTITDSTGTFSRGGGILISGSSPSILNCVIKNNQAQMGAGLHASNSLALNLHNLTFRSNDGLEGAGAYLHNIDTTILNQCSFVLNSAQTAGGALTLDLCSMAEISSSLFENNGALIGGALDSKQSSVQITDVSFRANEATLIGGAIAYYQSEVNMVATTLKENISGHGAAIGIDGGTVSLSYCLIVDNFATSHGGGIASTLNATTLNLHHVTIANNQALQGSSGIFFPQPAPGLGASTLIASHSILWNPGGQELVLPTLADTEYCNVEGGYTGFANLDADPLFNDPDSGNYSLRETSPCVDSGSASAIPDPDGTLPDIGAIWHDQRPSPITDLVCELTDSCDNTYTTSWNQAEPADAIVISIGTSQQNAIPVASLPGTATSWSTILSIAGNQTICVEPIENGMTPETGPICCQVTVETTPVPAPISAIACSVNDANCATVVTWSNGDQYSSIQLEANGVFEQLPGDQSSALVFLYPNTPTTIQLVATTLCGQQLTAVSCQALCVPPLEFFVRGDSNADGGLNLADIQFSLDAIFGLVTSPCPDAQDANDDGALDISDPLTLLFYLFGTGPAPPAPGLVCGEDPAAGGDFLDCPGSPGCP
ncbi:MAG: right-handed parallel beta-helix repeat-containing protein [Planctomycetota bacterium]|nr:right-handed parallel beta-helix repeat-containing protein [Planctomycetota bacterium]